MYNIQNKYTVVGESMVDLILFNANVISMNRKRLTRRLVAIRDGKILAVTANDTLKELRSRKTKVIDCIGKTLLPGFIDAHLHLHAFAESFVTLNFDRWNNLHSISDIQARIRESTQGLPPGTWIRGRGYHEFYFSEKRHPTRWDLDEAAPNHPIRLTHRSGRAHVLNTLALELASITKETPDPPGGIIDRDLRTGQPTGLLYGMGDFLSKVVPPLDDARLEHCLKLADRELLSLGITSIQDASSHNGIRQWEMFRGWKERGLLRPRVSMMLGVECFMKHRGHDFSTHVGGTQLRPGGVKIVLDRSTGRLNPTQQELNKIVLRVHQSGLQAVIHAVEETSIEAACSALEFALRENPAAHHRHRVEHCSVCPPALAKRLASLGATVVTQPPFIYYNGDRYLRTVSSAELKHLYPIATLMKNGIKVAGSSDCPIAPANPLIGIYSAISRTTQTGQTVLSEERIPPLDALLMYTDYAARANFEERMKGSVTPGKLADLIVVDGDPTTLPPNETKDISVEMTILNGEIAWDAMA